MSAHDQDKNIRSLGEFGFIDLLKKYSPISKDVIAGIGDDTAIVKFTKDKYQLLTTDMLIEGVHFTKKMDPQLIGRKALACNVSDIAAMGGTSRLALISLGVPTKTSIKFCTELYKGIAKLARKYNISVVGGDTVKSDKILINIALVGDVKKKSVVKRSGAKVGDRIFVTGKLGDSFKTKHHLTFEPCVKESEVIVKYFKPTSMIDVSDGLASDLGHILKQSKVGATLEENQIPLRDKASVENAFYDGEDYELLFTVSKNKKIDVKKFKFFEIGTITKQRNKIILINKNQRKTQVKINGYTHF